LLIKYLRRLRKNKYRPAAATRAGEKQIDNIEFKDTWGNILNI
jgi:hypothetical protein